MIDPLKLTPPESLRSEHELTAFNSGTPELDLWLQLRAQANERNNASRTYVISHGSKVIGYYSIVAGGIERSEAPNSLARNMPDPIPMVVLGRLAVDSDYQRAGLGKALMRDAMRRTVLIAEVIAIRGMLVHAINQDARNYYLRWGFIQSPTNEFTLCLPISTIRSLVRAHSESP